MLNVAAASSESAVGVTLSKVRCEASAVGARGRRTPSVAKARRIPSLRSGDTRPREDFGLKRASLTPDERVADGRGGRAEGIGSDEALALGAVRADGPALAAF